jgi:hypothetical protein
MPETLRPESLDVLRAMRFILQGSCQRLHIALTIALLAACAANLVLVCAWL